MATLNIRRQKNQGADAGGVPLGKKAKAVSLNNQARFVFIIGDDGAILIYMEGSTVVRRLFAPTATPEHTRAMKELIEQHPKASIRLLMDVIDQQYSRHNFPPVSSFSVNGLVNRRLERDFNKEDINGAIPLGREAGARKDWIYLLVSLVYTNNLQQWLELIIELPNHFSGITLVPVETQHYLSMLAKVLADRPKPEPSWQLLISHHKIGGFRVVVLRDGKLAFTRVAQAVGESTPAIIAGNVEQEVQNSIDYIRRLGFSENAGLEVFAVVASEVRDAIDSKRINANAIHLLSPYDVSELLGLKQAALTADRYGDVVIAAALSQIKKPVLTLQTGYSKKLDRFYKMQKLSFLSAIFLSLILGAIAAKNAFEAASSGYGKNTVKNELVVNTKMRDQLTIQVEALGKAANLKNDISTFLKVKKPLEHLPYDAIDEISRLQKKDVKITELLWYQPNDTNTNSSTSVSAEKGNVTLQIKAAFTKSFPDNDSIISAIDQYKHYVVKTLQHYDVTMQSASSQGKDSKISVAIGESKIDSTDASPVVIDITLTGPKADKATDEPSLPAAVQPSVAQPSAGVAP